MSTGDKVQLLTLFLSFPSWSCQQEAGCKCLAKCPPASFLRKCRQEACCKCLAWTPCTSHLRLTPCPVLAVFPSLPPFPTPPEVLPGILPLNLLVLHPCLHNWLLEESKLKCCLCWLPRMNVIKDHIVSDVKQQKFVLHNSGGFLLFFSCSVMFNSLWPHGLQHARLPCPSPSPGACSKSCPSSQWWHPTISSSVIRFSSCLQFFPASGSFLMSQLFASGGQSIGASVLLISIQDWFSLGLTGLISLQSKRLSRVFFKPQYKGISSSVCGLLYGPTLTSIHNYWKNKSFDYMDLCWQNRISAF